MGDNRPSTARQPAVEFAATLLSAALLGAILYWAKLVLMPIAVAVLITFVLSPLITKLQHWRFPRVLAVIGVMIIAGLLISGLIWVVSVQIDSLATNLPQYEQNIREKLTSLVHGGEGGTFDKFQSTFRHVAEQIKSEDAATALKEAEQTHMVPREPVPVRVVPDVGPEQVLGEAFTSLLALTPALEGMATAFLILIIVFFMLVQREDLRNRFVSVTGHGNLATLTKALDDAGRRISRYLLMQLIINATFGLAVGVVLFAMGVPYAALWGLCAVLLRYIPFIGPWIAAVLPMLVSLITSPGWTQLLLILALFVVLDLVVGNVMEPWLYGQGIGVSMVANLVAAAFWTWIWGPVGLILSTPLTVCLLVLGRYVPSLGFLERLLGDQPTLKPHIAYLQRLLAKDEREATEIVRQYRLDHTPDSLYDELFIPALALTRQDCDRGTMTLAEETVILAATQRILVDLAEPNGGAQKNSTGATETPAESSTTFESANGIFPAGAVQILTLGVPTRHAADELSLQMIAQLLRNSPIEMESLSTRSMPSDLTERVKQDRPAVVLIAALAPGGLVQARYLCKRLRKQFPELGIIVGFWGYKGNLDKIVVRLRSAGAQYVTTTLLGAREHVRFLANTATSRPRNPELPNPNFADVRPPGSPVGGNPLPAPANHPISTILPAGLPIGSQA